MDQDNIKIVRSTCLLCGSGCGVLVHVQGDKPVKVEGDPENPTNHGTLCILGRAALEYLNHPDRLKYPLKRKGERGAGQWQRISWDQALDEIASAMNRTKEKYGAASVAFMQGGHKGYSDSFLSRLANVFGSPNIASMSYICFHARLRGMIHTYGFFSTPDFGYPPSCMVMWGANPPATILPEGLGIQRALKLGAKLIVIDPAEIGLAKKADIWLKPRPGSDLALALAFINVIIGEELYDRDFVEKWTTGFEKLKEHVKAYTPEKVSPLTWVPADQIREAARLYASSKPAVLHTGNGQDNNLNNFQFNRAAAILNAITGNLEVPGGMIKTGGAPLEPPNSPDLHQRDAIPLAKRAKRVGAEEKVLPTYFSALPQKEVKAMLTSQPYPVRTAFIQGGGFLQTYSNVKEVYQALKSLDFLAVSDLFPTPTAELADIVLPVCSYLEMDHINVKVVTGVVQKVAQIGECRSDLAILNDLGKKLGLGKYCWDTEEQMLDYLLKPSGLSFSEFKKIGFIPGNRIYREYLAKGFHTPSGKVELYSGLLAEWGFDPLPVFHEPPESPFSAPEMAKEYPLVLASAKIAGYIHSGGRQIESVRRAHPDPIMTIHRETAKNLGISNGDWAYIETKRGRIKHKAKLSSNIDRRTVILEHGWWFPEKKGDMHGWTESNLNVLTSNDPPYARELGSVSFRGILCKVYKA